jgi:hypothetical protein
VICHCTDCQRFSSAPYRVSVPAAAADFRLLRGEPKVYVKTADSGAKRVQAFCETCGTPVYSSAVEAPPVYNLRLGTLEQRAEIPPRRQIWRESALAWADDIKGLAASQRG